MGDKGPPKALKQGNPGGFHLWWSLRGSVEDGYEDREPGGKEHNCSQKDKEG